MVRLLLDAPDGLDLRSLTMRPKLPEMFVLACMAVTLHNVLISTVARVLITHKSITKKARFAKKK